MDCFGDFVFRVASKGDVLLPVLLDDRCGANFEMRNRGAGSGIFSGVERAENLVAELCVRDDCFGFFRKRPGGGRGCGPSPTGISGPDCGYPCAVLSGPGAVWLQSMPSAAEQ